MPASRLRRRALLALLLTACGGGSARPRCGECGMFADVAPAFLATARLATGAEVHFDTPRCLFRRHVREPGVLRDAKVTEYYAQRLVALESVAYVVGSDVVGPMGRDLVPVARENVARFVADHGGQAIEPRAVDAAVLRRLDP